MKKLTSILFTVALVVFAGFNAHAQDKSAPSAVSPEKLVLIKELLALSGQSSQQMADEMYDAQMKETRAIMSRMFDSDEYFSAADKADLKKSAEDSFDRMAKKVKFFFKTELNLEAMLDEIAVTTYDKHFSESELHDLLAFYKSPTGKKSISVTPEMMREMMAYMFEKVMPKLEAFIKNSLDSEIAFVKQKSTPIPKKRKGAKKS